jgi:hypothetical protein
MVTTTALLLALVGVVGLAVVVIAVGASRLEAVLSRRVTDGGR